MVTDEWIDLYKQVQSNQWCDPPEDEDGNSVLEFVALVVSSSYVTTEPLSRTLTI